MRGSLRSRTRLAKRLAGGPCHCAKVKSRSREQCLAPQRPRTSTHLPDEPEITPELLDAIIAKAKTLRRVIWTAGSSDRVRLPEEWVTTLATSWRRDPRGNWIDSEQGGVVRLAQRVQPNPLRARDDDGVGHGACWSLRRSARSLNGRTGREVMGCDPAMFDA